MGEDWQDLRLDEGVVFGIYGLHRWWRVNAPFLPVACYLRCFSVQRACYATEGLQRILVIVLHLQVCSVRMS
jgi:hypothetical protein